LKRMIGGGLIIGVILFALITIKNDANTQTELTQWTCESEALTHQIEGLVEESPTGRTIGLRLVDIDHVSEVSRSPTELKCKGVASFNNAERVSIFYRVFDRNGKRFVEMQPNRAAEALKEALDPLAQFFELLQQSKEGAQ
jgi:hypothetical protein